MQIVIDLSDELYNYINSESYDEHLDKRFDFQIWDIVKKGTPLPKGHGRLIDADYLKDISLLHNWHGNNKNIVPYSDRRGYRLRQREVDETIINAPTIIEADWERSKRKIN